MSFYEELKAYRNYKGDSLDNDQILYLMQVEFYGFSKNFVKEQCKFEIYNENSHYYGHPIYFFQGEIKENPLSLGVFKYETIVELLSYIPEYTSTSQLLEFFQNNRFYEQENLNFPYFNKRQILKMRYFYLKNNKKRIVQQTLELNRTYDSSEETDDDNKLFEYILNVIRNNELVTF